MIVGKSSSRPNMIKTIIDTIRSSFSAGKNEKGDLRQCAGQVGFYNGDLRDHCERCDSYGVYYER